MEAVRLHLENQIKEQANQLDQIMQTVPEGIVLLDTNGQILLANKVGSDDLILFANAKVGETITHLGDKALNELLTSPPTQGLWHEVKADNRVFEVISRPIINDAKFEKWVLVFNDVTEKQEVQKRLQQQDRLAAVGQLAAGIAHDFNNIMGVITLYSELSAKSDEMSDDVKRRLGTIIKQAHHASRLIQQILDFSRRSVLEKRPFDLLLLLKEQTNFLKRTLPENIEIDLDYSKDLTTINADPTRIQQMITNLALNARDAMPDGGTLYLAIERIAYPVGERLPVLGMEYGEWVKLTVKDSGTGISANALPHIFEPFFTTKGPGEGNGLGLAQVHGIVGQHGGFIDVTTKLNEGTTFFIYFPAAHTNLIDHYGFDSDLPVQGKGKLILVVEDNAPLRAALVESLQRLGYAALEAANGEEALETMASRGAEISLILSDVIMPQMGGLALHKALRKASWQTPMIFMSGHPMDEELKGFQTQELKTWLAKPIKLRTLVEALAGVFADQH